MLCPRCRNVQKKKVSMKAVKRKGGFHKKTKFQCSECGLIRMKDNK